MRLRLALAAEDVASSGEPVDCATAKTGVIRRRNVGRIALM
jgi:hypothetical protein